MGKSEYKVEVHNLTKNFGSLQVLNDISFNVKKGEFICIVGPTGCGKTTFLNLLTRIYMPTKGDLLIDGESADPKNHNLAFVFQEPSALPWKTVEQNLRVGLELKTSLMDRWIINCGFIWRMRCCACGKIRERPYCLLPITLKKRYIWRNGY